MDPPIQLPRGIYYNIICKATEQAIKVEANSSNDHYKSKIVGCKINPQDNNQVFMIEKLDIYGQDYQIVSCPTDYVLEENGNQIELRDGKRDKNQLWTLIPASSNKFHQYFWIKCSYRADMALSLEGKLRTSTFDPNSQTQQFRLQDVNNITIQNSCIIVNNNSGKVMDVPKSSEKAGERIVIWDKNKRWNQRWYFQKYGQGYLIKNLVSSMCIDIAGEKRESGTKLVQWNQTGGTNQLWNIQQVANKLYIIRSCHEPSLCISVRKQEASSGAYLEVTDYQNATGYWKIEGALPK